MRSLKSLLMVVVALILVSCSMSAKPEKNETEKASAHGEVIALNKAELAAQYKDDIVIYKINVDNEKELATAFGIQSIPTLLFIPKTGKPQIAQGALSKEQFVEQIDNFLLKK